MARFDIASLNWLAEKSLIFLSIVAGFLFLALVIRHYLPKMAAKFAARLGRRLEGVILENLSKIIFAFIILTGIYLALVSLPLSQSQNLFVARLFRSIFISMMAWAAAILLTTEFLFTTELRQRLQLDNVLVNFFTRIIKFVVIALAIVLIAHEWGFDVNGFVAGLGLGGLAIALAAKDALANIFGGIVIIMEKPFSIGDQIQTPTVEGKVEDISFRSTRFRNADHALVTVPNSTLANEAITNLSRMGRRRVKFTLLLDFSGQRKKIETCLFRIRTMLEGHPGLYSDSISVHLQNISLNSLEIAVVYFTRAVENSEYLAVKEEINYRVLEILDTEKIALVNPAKLPTVDMPKF